MPLPYDVLSVLLERRHTIAAISGEPEQPTMVDNDDGITADLEPQQACEAIFGDVDHLVRLGREEHFLRPDIHRQTAIRRDAVVYARSTGVRDSFTHALRTLGFSRARGFSSCTSSRSANPQFLRSIPIH